MSQVNRFVKLGSVPVFLSQACSVFTWASAQLTMFTWKEGYLVNLAKFPS